MSELLALCDALSHVIQPLPSGAHNLRVCANRLRTLADEVQYVSNDVPLWMDCSSVVLGLYEAADKLEESAQALRETHQQGRSYIRRTVTVNSSGTTKPSSGVSAVGTGYKNVNNETQINVGAKSSAANAWSPVEKNNQDGRDSNRNPAYIGGAAASKASAMEVHTRHNTDKFSENELVALIESQGSDLVRDNQSPLGAFLRSYKGTGHISINDYLRPEPMHGEESNLTLQAISIIDRTFGGYQLDRDATLYRGISEAGLPYDIYDVDLGDLLSDGAFVSVSAKMETGKRFAHPLLFVIHAPAGVMYLPMSYAGDGLNEAELLLPRGTSMYVIPTLAIDSAGDDPDLLRFDVIPMPPGISRVRPGTDPLAFARLAWEQYEHLPKDREEL